MFSEYLTLKNKNVYLYCKLNPLAPHPLVPHPLVPHPLVACGASIFLP